jgi:putative transposase
MSRRPLRLATFSYVGFHRYSLTFCTKHRRPIFTVPHLIDEALEEISRTAAAHGFAVLAYCFMADHLHLLVEGTSDTSNLVAFSNEMKQRTAYRYRRREDGALWQKGYFDHVLRDDETTLAAVRYILANPVRAGLVQEPHDYPFSGSLVFDRVQLDELWQNAVNGTP